MIRKKKRSEYLIGLIQVCCMFDLYGLFILLGSNRIKKKQKYFFCLLTMKEKRKTYSSLSYGGMEKMFLEEIESH